MSKFIVALLLCGSLLLSACSELQESSTQQLQQNNNQQSQEVLKSLSSKSEQAVQTEPDKYDYVLDFPSNQYPETALHILGAIEQGYSDVCTIDRDGAAENRKQSLKGIDTKEGYDRDEWPMAMCEEGGSGASVAYIDSSDNRGAGSWVGHELSQYEDGTKVLFIVEKPELLFPIESAKSSDNEENNTKRNIVYNSCSDVRNAGKAPLYKGDPGYSTKLDRDGDGIACE